MTAASPLLQLNDVSKTYGSAEGIATEVLKGVSLALGSGETLAIVGPSGCGKSTLLNIIGTLDRATSGAVIFDGEEVSALAEKKLARLRNEKIGFVFQLHHLLPQCNVIENVLVPAVVHRDNKGAVERAARLLDRVGLSHRLTHRPGELSGGECQRVAVVRALINKPRLLLADEPTGSLDRKGAENLCQLLSELNKEDGVAMIMVTHSEHLASQMGRTFELREGNLAAP